MSIETFLLKHGYKEVFQLELPISKNEMISKLKDNMDVGSIHHLSYPFEAFSFSKKGIRGKVNQDGFTLRRKRTFFEQYASLAVANGKFSNKGSFLVIDISVNSWNGFIKFFLGFILFFYVAILIGVLSIITTQEEVSGTITWVPLFFIFFHAAFMLVVLNYILKRSVKRLKHFLERELHYWTTKS